MKRKGIREGSGAATAIMYILAVFVILITLYPMYYVLILSLSEPLQAMTMRVYTFPKGFDLGAYRTLIMDPEIWRSLLNSIMYSVVTTVLVLISSMLGAYPLTFKSLKGRKFINMYLLVTMYFWGGIIPLFLLVMKLGIYNNPLALILTNCYSVWNIILVKSYLSTIPETLREAAKIDGANVYQILFRIYLPLSIPILAVISVYTTVAMWNSWFGALIYLPDIRWQPLQLYLRRMLILLSSHGMPISADAAREMAARQLTFAQIKYAMIIFTSLPILFAYPFFQKYFMRGIMLGSLKE
jgi:putative aldouronate transport system permease protein